MTMRAFEPKFMKMNVPRPTFEDGLQNQRVLDAIERSVGTGRWEKIAERTNG